MKKTINIVLAIMCVAVFIQFYKYNSVPACVNADEAAFGYNAYSLVKTLKDEHGALLPLRLASFNDFKLPLYTYLSTPFVALFGLNDFSTRLLGRLVGIAFIPILYLLAYEITQSKKVGYLTALLATLSPWIYILSRHAHEAPLCALLISISILMLIKYIKKPHYWYAGASLLSVFLASFTYHSARFFLIIIPFLIAVYAYKSRSKKISKQTIAVMCAAFVVVAIPFIVDVHYGTNRVNNLLFTANSGFQKTIDEYLNEHPNRYIHNKGTQAIKEMTFRYLQQISPNFFVSQGDTNPRFGMPGISPITPIEYLGIFIGIYFLFRNRQRFRWLLVGILLLSPLANSLAWTEQSLTRTYIMIVPILLIVAYGFFELIDEMSSQPKYLKSITITGIVAMYVFFNFNSHDVYFNHYMKRAYFTRSWQCGYEEMTDYIKDNYDKKDKFFITQKYGQPYIFLLYFMKYDPSRYQNSADFSSPDEYGFTQVESFDKFTFAIPSEIPTNTTIIGYPDDFQGRNIDPQKIKKISFGNEEIFWIYEN